MYLTHPSQIFKVLDHLKPNLTKAQPNPGRAKDMLGPARILPIPARI